MISGYGRSGSGETGWRRSAWGWSWGWSGWERSAQKNFAFFPSPATIFALFDFLWVSSRGILVVFEAPEPSNVCVWSSLAVV